MVIRYPDTMLTFATNMAFTVDSVHNIGYCCCCFVLTLHNSYADKLIPRILVELTFAVAVSSVEADVITETVDRLIREHLLPKKSNVR